MKRAEFETRFEELGLNLSAYDNAAYYGAADAWSLALKPYGDERIRHAKLAIDLDVAKRDRVIVDTFLSAADVSSTPQLEEALAGGSEYRSTVGAKTVSFSAVGPDLVVNVIE